MRAKISERGEAQYTALPGAITLIVMAVVLMFVVVAEMNPTTDGEDAKEGEVDELAGLTGIARGEALYKMNCQMCHGVGGEGGVNNDNYIKGTVPALNTMADNLFLYEKVDANRVLKFLEANKPLDKLTDKEQKEIPGYNRVVAKYKSIRNVILNGQKAGKKNPKGPDPPLDMQAWKDRLSGEDINSILAYLITKMDWEEDEEEDEDEDEGGEPDESGSTDKPDKPGPAENKATALKPLKQGQAVPNVELIDQDGRKFTLSSLRGKTLVFAFIYTNCNDARMCPLATTKLVQVQGQLKKAGRKDVQILVLSFDPKRDTPAKLKEFAGRYSADLSWFRFATGRPDQVGPLAGAFNNYYRQTSPGVFNHTIVISLVDGKGILRDDFFGTGWEVKDFVDAITTLQDKK